MKLLPFAVAAIAAVNMTLVHAEQIKPGVALISQKKNALAALGIIRDINTVVVAPVVAVIDKPAPTTHKLPTLDALLSTLEPQANVNYANAGPALHE